MSEKKDSKLNKIFDNKWEERIKEVIRNLPPDLVKLPSWLPDILVAEFYSAQDTLQGRYAENESIIEIMKKYEQWRNAIEDNPENFASLPDISSDLRQEFSIVCRIMTGVRLGKDKGLSYLLGNKSEKLIKKKYERDRQKEVARVDRPDALQKLIIKILKENPKSKLLDVVRELKNLEGGKVIYEINDSEIEWNKDDGSLGKPAPISGLKARIRRAKIKIK